MKKLLVWLWLLGTMALPVCAMQRRGQPSQAEREFLEMKQELHRIQDQQRILREAEHKRISKQIDLALLKQKEAGFVTGGARVLLTYGVVSAICMGMFLKGESSWWVNAIGLYAAMGVMMTLGLCCLKCMCGWEKIEKWGAAR